MVEPVTIDELVKRLKLVEERLENLECLQKQDADEAVGMLQGLEQDVEDLEKDVEKLEDDVDHHKHLFSRYRMADLFGGK